MEWKRETERSRNRNAAERSQRFPASRYRDAVWSENTLLFHRDKKFNVWIITSELIDPACPRRISTELLTYFAYPLPTTTAEMLRFSEGTRLTERSFTYDID